MRFDLNLLIVLDALLSEGSVTAAARKLHLAQPTVSNALARLRMHFDDKLLERSGSGMKATPRARQLRAPLRDALAKIELMVRTEAEFDPRTATNLIRIAATDYVCAVLLPKLVPHLTENAPYMRLAIVDFTTADPIHELRSGQIDLLVGAFSKTSTDIHRYDLFTDEWVCVTRKNHPWIRKRITLKQFRDCTQITVRPHHGSVGGSIDDILAQMASQRNLTLSLPHLFSGLHVALASDVLLTLAARVAGMLGRAFPLQVLKHPLQLKPFVVSQLWHERTHLDPAHAWIRKALATIAAEPLA